MEFAVPDDLRAKFTAAGQGHVFSFMDSGVVRGTESQTWCSVVLWSAFE